MKKQILVPTIILLLLSVTLVLAVTEKITVFTEEKFQKTGWTPKKKVIKLPDGTINKAIFHVDGKASADPYPRFLDVYIEGTRVFRRIVCRSFSVDVDVTKHLANKAGEEVSVGIVLTTYVGYWIVNAHIEVDYTPPPTPENFWDWIMENWVTLALVFGVIVSSGFSYYAYRRYW